MSTVTDDATLVADYRTACDGFTDAVQAVGERWDAPTPAKEGDAGHVFDHVMGSLDELLLQPLGVVAGEPGDDRGMRWSAAVDALFPALAQPGALDKRRLLVGILTVDVLVHAWDLSRAVGLERTLDPQLCQASYDRSLANRTLLVEAGAIEPTVSVPDDAPIQDRLLSLYGRDPSWG